METARTVLEVAIILHFILTTGDRASVSMAYIPAGFLNIFLPGAVIRSAKTKRWLVMRLKKYTAKFSRIFLFLVLA